MAPVFLPVRLENYHFWQMLFILPLLILIWIFVSVLVHILGRGSRKGGSLRRTLAVFGFSLAGPVILLWVPQTAIAVFYGLGMGQQEMVDILSEPGPAQTLFLAAHGLALLWIYGLCSVAASVSQKIQLVEGLGAGDPVGNALRRGRRGFSALNESKWRAQNDRDKSRIPASASGSTGRRTMNPSSRSGPGPACRSSPRGGTGRISIDTQVRQANVIFLVAEREGTIVGTRSGHA